MIVLANALYKPGFTCRSFTESFLIEKVTNVEERNYEGIVC
ncbi:MAG: hypothetical protein ACLTT7_02715 [Paraclostridium bifermentans]